MKWRKSRAWGPALVGASLLGVVPGQALAQAIGTHALPSAQMRQMERQERQFRQSTQPPPVEGPLLTAPATRKPQIGQPGGPHFVLRGVEFDHSVFLTKAELNAVANRYIGKSVDFADLQRLVRDVNALYEAKGEATAAASLPPQRIIGGRVRIALVEGRLGVVKTEGRKETSERFFDDRLGLKPGAVIDVPALTQRARLINATSDVKVRLALEPGSNFGLTDIALGVTEPPLNTLLLFADNQAVQTTGVYEGGVYYKRSDLLGIDDRLTLYATASGGELGGNLGYNLPIGDWGTRVGVSFGRSAIHVVQGPTTALHVQGRSETASLNASQPLFVSAHWITQAVGSFTYETSRSTLGDVFLTKEDSYREAVGLSLTYSDLWGTVTFSPAVAPVQTRPLLLAGNRDFTLFVGNASATAELAKDTSLQFNMAWQWTTARLLPSSQLFQIGGPTTVRGYPTDSIAGDSGVYANFELHHALRPHGVPVDLYAFSDAGAVDSTYPIAKSMVSFGVGGSVSVRNRVTLQGAVAVPVGLSVSGQRGVALYFRLIISVL